jgi:hypothetical protein
MSNDILSTDIINKAFYDAGERKFTFVRTQDVEPILDQNKAFRSMEQTSDTFRHTAQVPMVLIEQWLQEEWRKGNTTIKFGSEECDLLIYAKLQDPDYAYLRTDMKSPMAGWSAGLV